MNAPRIKPNPTRSAGSTAILEFLAGIWPRTARRAELSSVFAKADAHATATQTLAKRVDTSLSSMVKSGMLSRRGDGADREWGLGPEAQLLDAQEAKKRPREPYYAGVGVPAPKYDVMNGPTYVPDRPAALRPGAQEFLRCPSLHQGQRLPFTGGYIGVTGSKS